MPLEVLHELGLDPAGVLDRVRDERPRSVEDAILLAPYQPLWLVATTASP